MNLTAIVLTHNNQDTLPTCLKSLGFANEIVVIDDYSTDQTVTLAKKFAARVYRRHLHANFAAQRNFALKKAQNDWVVFVDSDELVPPSLAREIKSSLQRSDLPRLNGYFLRRQDIFLGKSLKHGETGQIKLLRLARKSAGRWHRPVHEFWQINGKTSTLTHTLLHHRHLTISQFLTRLDFYTSLDAQALLNEKKPFRPLDLFAKPCAKFIVNYFLKLGFLDGFPGFAIAYLMSLHSLIVRVKLWPKQS